MKRLSNKIVKMKPSGIREFFDYASEKPEVVSLSVGEPDFVTPAPIIKAAKKSLDEGKTFYTSNQGLPTLRKRISKYLKERFDIHYDYEEIILTAGSSQAILNSLMAIINPGDEVIVTEPTYICYVPDIKMCGGKSVVIPLTKEDDFKLKPEKLKKYITPNTKAVFLGFPNNPTGAIMTKEDLELIAPIILKNDLYVITDEIYAELTYGKKHFSITSMDGFKERTILISGFSKAFAMTGWRLGYVCADKPIIQQILKIQQYIMLSAPTISQYGAEVAFDDCMTDLAKMADEYNSRRQFLLNTFKELGIDCFNAEGAFYLFPSIKRFGLCSRDFCLKLLHEYNVLIVPGSAFGESGEGYVRVSYATSRKNIEYFADVLRKLVKQENV